MKKIHIVLVLVFVLSLFLTSVASASPGNPVGGCEPGFELHLFMDHDGEHMHKHIGVPQDLNGDGYTCLKMLPNNLHLHVDNSVPLR